MLRAALVCVAMLAVCQATAQAGLTQVGINTFPSSTVVVRDGYTITRSLSNTSGGVITTGGSLILAGNATADLTYTITGGGFGDYFDSYKGSAPTINPNASAVFDGFLLSLNADAGSVGTVAVGATSYNVTDGFQSLAFRDFLAGNPTSVTFNLSTSNGGIALSSVSAVPEPSALLLVGSVLGAGLLRRRRS